MHARAAFRYQLSGMNWPRSGSYWPVLSVFLAGCARTELPLDSSLDESGGASAGGLNGTTAGGASGSAAGGSATAGGATGGNATGGTTGMPQTCANTVCVAHEVCDPKTITCNCSSGFSRTDSTQRCLAIVCKSDVDCDDGDPCNGDERCDPTTNSCQAGTPVLCPAHKQCVTENAAPTCECANGYSPNSAGTCLPVCDVPLAPVINVIDNAEILHWRA